MLPISELAGCYHARVHELSSSWRAAFRIATSLALILCGCRAEDPCRQLALAAPQPREIDLDSSRISQRNLRTWVRGLTDPSLAGRHAGEPGGRTAAAWMAREMARLGLEPGNAGFCRGYSTVGEDKDFNVIGRLAGAPATAPQILLAAHYDGQGRHPSGRIYPGADDNASGVAALLEVARLARRRQSAATPAALDWLFVASGAEEIGQLGAREVLAAASFEAARLALVVNLDMVGRRPRAQPAIGYLALGENTSELVATLGQAAHRAGIEVVALDDFGEAKPTLTDAHVFSQRYPTLLLSTALHEDHHRLTDTPDRLDFDQIERAAAMVLALADIIADPS